MSEFWEADISNTTHGRTLVTKRVFAGRCWKFGHHIPTDMITPTHIMFKAAKEMAAFVLETLNPDFPKHVKPGDILVAGRNFGCSSGRALAAKALQASGIGAVVAELFSRAFYRNSYGMGLFWRHLGLQTKAPSPFLLEMLAAGGLITLLKSGSGCPMGLTR